ncbi:MAG: GNAT family N-acetyltransferase [archaeon]|nr:GNAT family N-acetyltransferase [archaeon]
MQQESTTSDAEYTFVKMTHNYMSRNLDMLHAIEQNWTGIGEDEWKRKNYFLDLPLKWELSLAVEDQNSIIGYLFASEDCSKVISRVSNVNKIVVDYPYRGHGIGKQLMEKYFEACLENGIEFCELKALTNNSAANNFYAGLGFKKTGELEGTDNLIRNIYEKRLYMKVPHSRPMIDEGDIKEAVNVLRTGMLASGDMVSLFEEELSRYIGVRGGVAVNSGTNALILALKALDIKQGDEVIIPSYVCVSVLTAVESTGATAVFADTEPDSYNIGYRSAEDKITENTKSIIVPHLFGNPADIDRFVKLDVPIIEDCAQSIGSNHDGKKLGSSGLLSIYSFYATKVMTTGQGGMVMTDSEEMLEKLKDLTRYDKREDYAISYNFSLTDIQAAIGINQLKRLDSFIEQRQKIAGIYNNTFEELNLVFPIIKDNIYFRYVIEVDNVDSCIKEMGKRGVCCDTPIFKPLHQYFDIDDSEYPNTKKVMDKAISIPLYPSLKPEEINFVCDAIKAVWTG